LTTFAKRLRAAMACCGANQMDLARTSGVSQATISRLLSGQRGGRVSTQTMVALASALDVSVEWLASASLDDAPDDPTEPPTPEPETQTELLRAILAELRAIRQRL
jgi:transcriptional regulator with XRE-family HTH domain